MYVVGVLADSACTLKGVKSLFIFPHHALNQMRKIKWFESSQQGISAKQMPQDVDLCIYVVRLRQLHMDSPSAAS